MISFFKDNLFKLRRMNWKIWERKTTSLLKRLILLRYYNFIWYHKYNFLKPDVVWRSLYKSLSNNNLKVLFAHINISTKLMKLLIKMSCLWDIRPTTMYFATSPISQDNIEFPIIVVNQWSMKDEPVNNTRFMTAWVIQPTLYTLLDIIQDNIIHMSVKYDFIIIPPTIRDIRKRKSSPKLTSKSSEKE